jgi:hypothetical protein
VAQEKKADYIHTRKEDGRTLIKILWQPKKPNNIHHATNPNPRVNLLESQEHVQVTLRHPQRYVSTWCYACWHESDNFHTKPFVSQRTRTFTYYRHHRTYIHISPTNHPTCTHKTTQRLNKPFQHPPHHRPNITPSKRKFGSHKAGNLTKKSHNGQKSMKFHKETSSEKYAAKRDNFHNDISLWQESMTSLMQI